MTHRGFYGLMHRLWSVTINRMARTTIKDIARECGVSLSTVSLVLNNNPRISAGTREKVMKAVEQHQYQPNAFARSLASQSSQVISVVLPDLNHVFADVYFGEIVSGIYEGASSQGYKILLDVANQRFISGSEHVNLLKSRRVDGLLYIGSSIYDTFLYDLESEPYPALLVNHYFPNHKLPFISADYIASARLASDHLMDLGHRRIGLLCGTNTNTALDFRANFLDFCAARGAREADLPWADGWFTEQGGYEGTQWLMERNPGLTAIMAGNDKMAVGALRYFKERKLRVPEDVSVLGMDDIPAAQFTIPGLTTIRHDLFEIGEQAITHLITMFKEERHALKKFMPVNLVVRESTGPAPAK